MRAAIPPTRTTRPDPDPALSPCSRALVTKPPVGPRATSFIVSSIKRRKSFWSRSMTAPTKAINAGNAVSMNWNAKPREWLNPSAARKRSKESRASRPQPVLVSVSRASSPSSSWVCGTAVAVLMTEGYPSGRASKTRPGHTSKYRLEKDPQASFARLARLPVRRVRTAPATELLELDSVTGVVPVLLSDVVAPLARSAFERHVDAAVRSHG